MSTSHLIVKKTRGRVFRGVFCNMDWVGIILIFPNELSTASEIGASNLIKSDSLHQLFAFEADFVKKLPNTTASVLKRV